MTWLRHNMTWLFAIAAAVAILVMPAIADNEYALRFYTLMLIYTMIALGLNILLGYAGLVSLGQAGLYAIGAYTAAILATRIGLGFIPCLVLGMIFSALFGVLLAYPTVRVRGVYLAVVTIAFGIIVENVAIEWDWLTGSWVGISGVPAPTLLGLPLSYQMYFYVVGALALFTYVVTVNVMNSRFGRAMLASSQSEIAARSLGVNVTMIRTLAFVISAVTAGAAGVFYVFLNKYISPDIFSFNDSVRFLLMVILGGAGTTIGPVVGAGILSYLPEVLQQFGEWQRFVYGALLAGVMFFLPRGIVGSIADLSEHLSNGNQQAEPETPVGSINSILAFEHSDSDTCLQTMGLSVHFGGLVALDNVETSIQRGKIHALIGPNGAGKSTLLNAVSGIYQVTSGTFHFMGEEVTALKSHQLAQRGLARTFQNTELFSDMSVLENVLVGFNLDYHSGFLATVLRLPGYRKEEARHRQAAQDLLAYVGLGRFANEKAKNLPFGHQRKLEIARALAIRPKLLLLDEPAAGLTHGEISELRDLIVNLVQSGITILVVEHHVELVLAISEYVTVLDYGEVIAAGAASDVRDDPKVIEAYFGSTELVQSSSAGDTPIHNGKQSGQSQDPTANGAKDTGIPG